MVHSSNLWSRRRIGHGPCISTGALYHHVLQSDKRRRFAVRASQCLAEYDVEAKARTLSAASWNVGAEVVEVRGSTPWADCRRLLNALARASASPTMGKAPKPRLTGCP